MKKINPSQLVVVILSIIFGSAILILGYNLILGRNLARSPQFDLSAYNELMWGNPAEIFQKLVVFDEGTLEKSGIAEKFIEKVIAKIKNENVFYPQGIYFSEYFASDTAGKTRVNLDNFLRDFPELTVYPITDLVEQKCYSAKIPVESRESLIEKLKVDPAVDTVAVGVGGVPNFEVCFNQAKYPGEAQSFFTGNGLIFEAENDLPDYIAYLKFGGDGSKIQTTLDKFREDFSDVIWVVE